MGPHFATGGCQCGAVRYGVDAPPVTAEFCHCRMCQKAVGNVFGAYADFRRDDVHWVSGAVTNYRSSDIAQRGFCTHCGTPLTFDGFDEPTIGITLGSLDDPGLVPVTGHCGIQGKVIWLELKDGLPRRATGEPYPEDGAA